jgi:hypothetical protein
MKTKVLLATAALAAIFALVVPADAASVFRSRQSGDWDDYNTWEEQDGDAWSNTVNVPGSADDVTIRNPGTAHDVDVDTSESADRITVEAGSRLDIESGGTLTIDGDDYGNVHYIDGTIYLHWQSGSPNTFGTLAFTTSDHTLSYASSPGTLDGTNVECLITINSGLTLTSTITVQGAMEIKDGSGDSTFENQGAVLAYIDGVLKISTHVVEDTAGGTAPDGRWQVTTDSDAVLRFAQETNASLDGDFTISLGKLDIQRSVSTSGEMSLTDRIQVAELMSFTASN